MLRRFSRTRSVVAWLGATIGLVGAAAHASAQSTAPLVWSAPPGCPDREQAERRLAALTGDGATTHGHAEVAIDHAPTGELRALVVLAHEGRREQRELFGRSCDALSDAALLVVGLSLDGAQVQTGQPSTSPRKPSVSLARPEDNVVDLPRPQFETQLMLASLVALDTGALPALALGAGGGLALRKGRARVELDATFWRPQTVKRVAATASGRAQFALMTLAARACYTAYRMHSAGLRLCPCAGLELGQARGDGRQLGETHDQSAVWSALLFGLTALIGPYHRLAPVARVELGLPFRRPSFELGDGRQVFQAPAVLARFTLRLELDLL